MHRHNSNTTNDNAFKPPPRAPIPGQITFKLMCRIFTAGGVIGHSGTVIKLLQKQTSTRIKVDKPQPDSVERFISVTGSKTVSRTIAIMRGDEVEMMWDVSAAQEGLIRVLERIFEVEGNNNNNNNKEGETDSNGGVGRCRLVIDQTLIGVILKGEDVIRIRKQTGARIKLLRQADPTEGLIHVKITGRPLAVKNAVLIISSSLQDYSPFCNAPTNVGKPINTAPGSDFTDPRAEILADLKPLLLNLPEDYTDKGDSSVSDAQISNMDNIDAQRKVVFRLLLSLKAAKGVIGKGGSIIGILQNETDASIKAADFVVGCNDRLFILSSFEISDASNSPAQKAVVRVFARSIEAAIEKKIDMGETLTARLLIDSNQVNCMSEGGGTFISELKEVSGAEIQISQGHHHPSYGLETDELVQITGQYRNVQIALLHITGRLRDHCFPNKVLKGVNNRNYPESAIPVINPIFGFSAKSHSSMATTRRHKTVADGRVTTDKGNPLPGSTHMYPPVDTVKEVVLPEKALASAYGENDCNLKVIMEAAVSGDKITVVDGLATVDKENPQSESTSISPPVDIVKENVLHENIACPRGDDSRILKLKKEITGRIWPFKQAVLNFSGHLQDYLPSSRLFAKGEPSSTAPCGDFTDPLILNLPEDSIDKGISSVSDAQISYTDNIDAQMKVVFRLLLSLKAAGGVIGKGGSVIWKLRNETRASIKAADFVVGCNDRLFILSSFEKPDTPNSPAQKAVLRVFARSIEAAIEKKINMGETLTARLLIASNEVNCLNEGGGTFITELKEVSGAEIQISQRHHHPSYGLETDELVQITGQYQNVQIALLHITGRLRDYCFPNKVLKGVNDRSYPESAIPDINPNLGFSTKSHSPMATVRRHETTIADSRVTADRGNLHPGSTSMSPVDTVKEVVLLEKAFASVYGEDGRNLELVKKISGAEVIVDTSPNKIGGKVIISGTHDQIQMAQSVLQAFIGVE